MLIGIAGTRRMGRPDSAVARGARFAAAGHSGAGGIGAPWAADFSN
jgi:hypothetical protein